MLVALCTNVFVFAQTCPHRGLAGFGPISAATFGYPAYYVDQNGLALGTCLDPLDLACGLPPDLPNPAAPLDIASGNFFSEHLYTFVTATVPMPGGGIGLVVFAVTGTFGAVNPIVGDQVVFSRIRFRIDTPSAGTYTITHPFGVNTFTAAAPGRRSINFTDDCLLSAPPTCGPAGFNAFTTPLAPTAFISNWLQWDATAPAPPPGRIGDPALLHTITGSPCGTNLFRVEGPGLPPGGVETNLWSVLGKKASICGNGVVDPGEQCDDGNALDGDCCSSLCQFEATGSACVTDTNPCTDQTCNGAGACLASGFNTAPCDDLNPCTTDVCANGACVGTPNDANVCSDGNACTTGDFCSAGRCISGLSPTCVTASIVQDASVVSSAPTALFGTTTTLEADQTSATAFRQSFLRFNVSGIGSQAVTSARLRLQVSNLAGSNSASGGRAHVSGCAWDEATVTWNNRPAFNPIPLSTLGAVNTLGQIVEFDVTPAVQVDGTACFAIDSLSNDTVRYNSREAAAGAPQLVVSKGCACAAAPVCGDGLVNQVTEFCDGAASAACPGGCRPDCQCAVCGDGIINQAAEQCDGTVRGTCTGLCTATCTCAPAVCGDGLLNQASEQCDGAASAACPGACLANCRCPIVPFCGDGVVNQPSEQCDGAANATCTLGCTPACTCVTPAAQCGDGIINQASEQCDGAAVGACTNGCTATCTCAAPAGGAVTASVVADTSVRIISPTTNFGTSGGLDVDFDSAKQAFLRINVTGIGTRTVTSAKLRLFVPNAAGNDSNSGGRIHTMSAANCAWNETTVTWNTKPTIDGPVLSTLGTAGLGQTVEFDITSAVHDGTFCLGIDSLSQDNVRYASREAATGKPQIIITLGGAATPVCGDGIINQASEQCDGAAVGVCTNGCTATCTCAAAAPRCGDGIINQASEQCDGAAVGACTNGCTATCTCAAAAGGVVTASVVADVTARAASPTTTFGTASVLDVDANSAKETYFRLSVSGIGARTVASAKLRLFVPNTAGADSPSGGRIHTMTNCTWNETTVTWNTKPVIDGPVLSTLGAVTLGQTVEFDITSAVHDGTFCLGADSLVADNARYSSREASANKPQVIITLAP